MNDLSTTGVGLDGDDDSEEWETIVTEEVQSDGNEEARIPNRTEHQQLTSVLTTPQRNNDRENNAIDSDQHLRPQQSGDSSSVRRRRQRIGDSQQNRTPTTPAIDPEEDSAYRKQRMKILQRKLETKRHVKKALVEHPMKMMWSRFLIHFGRELWGLDAQIRLGLFVTVVGMLTNVFLISTVMLWYPRLFFLPVLLLSPFVYLDPSCVQKMIGNAIAVLASPAATIELLMNRLDPVQMRRLCLALIFVPTLLKIRTIRFLSSIQTECSWTVLLTSSIILFLAMGYCYKVRRASPREVSYIGLLVLYGLGLIVTLLRFDIRRIPFLVAPFFSATGVLLLTSHQEETEWCSRIVRHALRLTLRDVLSQLSESVSTDEMLQLAMLRWIVDYWSNAPATDSNINGHSRRASRPPSGSESRRRRVVLRPSNELTWNDLLQMLTLTTDQMASEADSLQSHSPVRSQSGSVASTETISLQTRDFSRPPGSQSTNEPSRTSIHPSSESSGPGNRPSPHNFDSVESLRVMLTSMNLDEHAKPAVLAYKRGIHSFPPARSVAILFAVARRCPALLTLLSIVFLHMDGGFSSVLILLPLIVFELMRIKEWSVSCERTAGCREDREGRLFLENVDPMIILLSEDRLSLYRPPSLLVVWMNVCSSVPALETGLTAARCAQTTAVAIDFAGNLMSLAQFGVEVSQHGWLYGAGILIKEIILLHSRGGGSQGMSRSHRGTRYSQAASQALQNGQVISRNVQVLIEEEDAKRVIDPLLGVLSIIFGKGWIWAREERRPIPHSTVKIEELDDADASNDPDKLSCEKLVAGESAGGISVFDASIRAKLLAEEPDTSAEKSGAKADTTTELSEVMDLVAICAERGLIEESDKKSVFEKLATFSPEKEADLSFLKGTRQTLEGLLSHSERDGAIEVVTLDNFESMSEKKPENEAEQIEGTSNSAPGNQKAKGDCLNDSESIELSNECRESTRGASPSTLPLGPQLLKEEVPHIVDEGSSATIENKIKPYQTWPATSGEEGLDDNDKGFEALLTNVSIVHTTNTRRQSAAESDLKTRSDPIVESFGGKDRRVSKARAEDEDGQKNVWMQIGGGLAVLGAVIGGVALATNLGTNEDNRRKQTERKESVCDDQES